MYMQSHSSVTCSIHICKCHINRLVLWCLQAIKQVQADYEKRLKDVEAQREQLLNEMETRETSLIAKVYIYFPLYMNTGVQ